MTNEENFICIVDSFENVQLNKVDLIYSCFSLQFCNPEKINDVMNKIIKNIKKDGYFVRKFFRNRG